MSIATNFFPISLSDISFEIRRIPFIPNLLGKLRQRHNDTHSFFRNQEYIYVSPMIIEQEAKLGEPAHILASQNLPIISSLIKHIFFRKFREEFPDILPLSFYPFRFLSRRTQDDYIADLLPYDLQGTVSRKKLIEIQFRDVLSADKYILGAVINLKSRWLFDKNCSELLDEGFEIGGRLALTSEIVPGLEKILAPDETLIGRIISVDNNSALVETSNGTESHPLDQLSLSRSTRNIQDYLEFRIGDIRTQKIFTNLRQLDEDRFNAESYYQEIMQVASIISKIEYSNLDGFGFSIANLPLEVRSQFSIQQTSFLFDYTPGASHSNASTGLTNFGPYDSSTFSPKSPKILIVCHKYNRGGFTAFAGKLKSGLPASYNFRGGMIGKYRLHEISFDVVEVSSYSSDEYKLQISNYIRNCEQPPNLALVETHNQFRDLPDRENPYFNIRAYLLSLGIPVQFIQNEKIRGNDKKLQWICDSVALQLYAKLGGIPWVLPSSSTIDHEIVVGIGSTILRETVYQGSSQERIVAITTFFSGDGRYIFGNRCKDVTFDKYFDELLTSLRQSISNLSQEYGWQSGDAIRIVFHIFKPIKNIESEVVEQLLKEFDQFNIKFCFVTITDNHPFLMFDPNQQGQGGNNLGKFIPLSRTNWILNEYSCILQLIGSQDISYHGHRLSSPILIKIHPNSTYTDLNSISQQIFNFSHLSWRGFKLSQQPATILYSDLMAQQLSKLQKIEGWNSDLVNTLLRDKKWFL